MLLTNKEKIDAFRYVLSKLDTTTSICKLLAIWIKTNKSNNTTNVPPLLLQRVFPEMFKYKPSMIADSTSLWWPLEDTKSRVEFCNLILKELL